MAADRAYALLRRLLVRAGTVRVRTTLAAVVVVGLALLLGAIALVAALRMVLTREVRTSARLQAGEVVRMLESGHDPASVVRPDTDLLIQLVDAGGQVVAASPQLADRPALARLRPGESASVDVPFDDDRFLTVAATAKSPAGHLTVLVGRSLGTVSDSTQAAAGLLALGLPVMLLVVAGTTWRVVGRALAPVDAIRREVDEISGIELHRRVPDPPGTDEIARLALTMNRMLDRLQQARDRQRRFVSDASHELRSPLAVIRQYAEVAAAHPGRIAVDDLAGTVLAETARMQRLVDDLLLLARADERTLRLRRRAVDLDDLVFDEAQRLRATTRPRIDTTAVSAGRVDGDAEALRRVLRNLADNAAHHARARIAFSLTEQDGWVRLDVDDDGPGIPPSDRERVFERFVRLDDARTRDGDGAGLGLAIVAELVAAHDGGATVADSPLGGTRVALRLPALTDPK
jgi:signal transduction histidine kinase